MASSHHFKHPLYAFLQPESCSPRSAGLDSGLGGHDPPAGVEETRASKDGKFTRDLVTITSTVQSHSSQLDKIVAHVNSLVQRVESVEMLSQQSQEQLQELVSEFKTDADKIALETGDRVTRALEPALTSLTNSAFFLTQQLEAIRSRQDRQDETQNKQGLSLTGLEKEVHHLSKELSLLNSRLSEEKAENMRRVTCLQEELKFLNSTLKPIATMAPLLQAFLEGQLRSSSSDRTTEKTSESHKSSTHNEKLFQNVTSKPRNSCVVRMKACSTGTVTLKGEHYFPRLTWPAESHRMRNERRNASLQLATRNTEHQIVPGAHLDLPPCYGSEARRAASHRVAKISSNNTSDGPPFEEPKKNERKRDEGDNEPTTTQNSYSTPSQQEVLSSLPPSDFPDSHQPRIPVIEGHKHKEKFATRLYSSMGPSLTQRTSKYSDESRLCPLSSHCKNHDTSHASRQTPRRSKMDSNRLMIEQERVKEGCRATPRSEYCGSEAKKRRLDSKASSKSDLKSVPSPGEIERRSSVALPPVKRNRRPLLLEVEETG